MKNNSNDYVLTPEQEKELYRRLEEDEKGLVKYISSKKALKEIRAKLRKKLQNTDDADLADKNG